MTKTGRSRSADAGMKPQVYKLPHENPYASFEIAEVSDLWAQLHKGVACLDDLIVMSNGIIDVTRFFRTFAVLADPLHPSNEWRSVVEQLFFKGRFYFRLATEIPVDMKTYWEEHGHPPRNGWGFCTGIAGGQAVDDSIPNGAGALPAGDNPYQTGSVRHGVFALAREFRPFDELIGDVVRRLGLTRKKATCMWWDLAHPRANKGKSVSQERNRPDGVREVRLVRVEPSR